MLVDAIAALNNYFVWCVIMMISRCANWLSPYFWSCHVMSCRVYCLHDVVLCIFIIHTSIALFSNELLYTRNNDNIWLMLRKKDKIRSKQLPTTRGYWILSWRPWDRGLWMDWRIPWRRRRRTWMLSYWENMAFRRKTNKYTNTTTATNHLKWHCHCHNPRHFNLTLSFSKTKLWYVMCCDVSAPG